MRTVNKTISAGISKSISNKHDIINIETIVQKTIKSRIKSI